MITAMIICGFAGWRLASLLVAEDGPGKIFERLRVIAGLEEGEIKGFLPEMLTCVWCTSVWTTGLMFAVWWHVAEWIPTLIGAMAVAVTVEQVARMAPHHDRT